jgi:hypothetical protein
VLAGCGGSPRRARPVDGDRGVCGDGSASILGIVLVAAIMILMITGSVLIQRGSSHEWFEAAE